MEVAHQDSNESTQASATTNENAHENHEFRDNEDMDVKDYADD